MYYVTQITCCIGASIRVKGMETMNKAKSVLELPPFYYLLQFCK